MAPSPHRHPGNPWGDGWGTGALPAVRTQSLAWCPCLGERLQSQAKSCRKEGKTWEIPVEEEQERAEKVNGLGG